MLYRHKVKQIIELAETSRLFVYKGISEEIILFSVNVNANVKFLSVLRGLPECTQALQHSQGTWALVDVEST